MLVRWTRVLFAAIPLLAGCVPGTPHSPIGLTAVGLDAAGEATGLSVLYMACPGEQIERIEVLVADRVQDPDPEPLWTLESTGQPPTDGDGLIELRLDEPPPGFEVVSGGPPSVPDVELLLVRVSTNLFSEGVYFELDGVREDVVSAIGQELSRAEFEEQLSCEQNRQ